MIRKLLESSRYTLVIAVLGSYLAALATLLYGAFKAVLVVVKIFEKGVTEEGSSAVTVTFIQVIDLFLIGTVFYIIALGLFELFVDDRLELPPWLIINNFDDLKRKLVNGIVVVLAVAFLGSLLEWNGQTDILRPGLAIALIIAALTFFQYATAKRGDH